MAVPHHGGRRGPRPAANCLPDRDRRRGVVAGGTAGGGRPGHRGAPRRRRQADRPAARAVERPHPGARVRRPVLPARPPRVARPACGTAAGRRAATRSCSRTTPTSGCTWPGRRPPTGKQAAASDHPGPGRGRPRSAAGPGRAALRRLRARPRTTARSGACRSGTPAARSPASIVAVPLDGSAADDPAAIRQLVTGSDFFAFPTPSPDGKRLAWICWNHPHMPWDGTELRVAPVQQGGRMPSARAGWSRAACASRCWPRLWRDNTSLYVATDWTGWWNIYQIGLAGEPPQALYPAEEEFAGPLWQLGERPFAAARRRAAGGRARPGRHAARGAGPGHLRADRPGPAADRVRAERVRGRQR